MNGLQQWTLGLIAFVLLKKSELVDFFWVKDKRPYDKISQHASWLASATCFTGLFVNGFTYVPHTM